ncbi:MAG TPA: helix-turn-helix domain-containing protein, partial [Caulifigura sp.]|nr:helix-turn-helix domain-containing protein [Caulifigura sp.]
MPALKPQPRLTTQERRAAILASIRAVFAEKGFHGTTTRELAQAAGVSEALLFKHFPSKDAMYAAMQEACWNEVAEQELKRLAALPANTSSLVLLVYVLTSKIISGPTVGKPNRLEQLMLRSMLEDGTFARGILKRFDENWLAKFEECLKAATSAGDVARKSVPGRIAGWFVHDLAVMVMIQLLKDPPVADYGATRSELIDHAVRFVLHGIGLSEAAIVRHFNPQAFALFSAGQ